MSATGLQTYLRAGHTLADLEATYGIKAIRHGRYPDLWSFKYDQLRSPMAERICQEARGSVLDAGQDWAYVARAFDKFWNLGEGLAAPIDWTYARVQEKVDGSLCILYWYNGAWEVATSGSPDASGPVDRARDWTFRQLFWETARARHLAWSTAAQAYTWLFELTSPLNRIVVRHGAADLTLIGCRHTATGDELPVALTLPHISGVAPVREYGLHSWAEVQAAFAAFSPLDQEGYVVVDYGPTTQPAGWQCPRVKVKHPGYVALHHMRNRFTPRGLVGVVQTNEMGEVLAAFPEITELQVVSARYDTLCAEIDADWDALQARWPDGAPTRREFAAIASTARCPAALFARLDGKTPDARTFLAGMHVDRLLPLLDVPALASLPAGEE